MALTFNNSTYFQQSRFETPTFIPTSCKLATVSTRKRFTTMASVSTAQSVVGLSETFKKLKDQKRYVFSARPCFLHNPHYILYITAGDPDLSTTAEALKVLDSRDSDIIELGVPYSDPLADGPVIQAAATRALARGTSYDAIISMLKNVVQLHCSHITTQYSNVVLKILCPL